jgi:hypothetical protein
MEGDIVYQQGNYIEMVIEDLAGVRLIACFDFVYNLPNPIDIKLYRVEYLDEGTPKHQTAPTLADARTLFNVLTERHSPDVRDRLRCMQLAARVRNGWCINCGTDKDVDKALCGKCRMLPRFTQYQEDNNT